MEALILLIKGPNELASCALGGLQRIDLWRFLSRPGLCHVGRHGAFPCTPFDSRLRENETVLAGRKFFGFLASDALFNDLMAGASVELASVLAHEETLNTLFYLCANHGYHILSVRMIKKKKLLCRKA
jgi:hypothetical protein